MNDDPKLLEYRNKFTLNQRGGSLEINNSTEREEVKISQYSGSNITLGNVVNSELAVNNKQTKVLYDEFRSVGNTLSEFSAKDRVTRVGENTYDIKGFINNPQLDSFIKWKESYREIANINSQFSILRGGVSVLGKVTTPIEGSRVVNPDLGGAHRGQLAKVLNSSFPGYTFIPKSTKNFSEVDSYTPIGGVGKLTEDDPDEYKPTTINIEQAFDDIVGSEAPGILLFGPGASSATEGGEWSSNNDKENLTQTIIKKQDELNVIEQEMGDGGDEIEFIKRHKVVTIGATFNDYPSVRIDPFGKSVPAEIGISYDTTLDHREGHPLVEEIDNSSNFPCGNYTMNVGNKYILNSGSGGIHLKTAGVVNINGGVSKISGSKVQLVGSYGITLHGERNIDLVSQSIQLRSNRQVLVHSSLGIDRNVTVKGGLYVEGESYFHHITAPIEVQQTYNTEAYGEAVQGKIIGYVTVNGSTLPVYGSGIEDSIRIYSHSHHFPNLPLTLTDSHRSVRVDAVDNKYFNKPYERASSEPIRHEFKGFTKFNKQIDRATDSVKFEYTPTPVESEPQLTSPTSNNQALV